MLLEMNSEKGAEGTEIEQEPERKCNGEEEEATHMELSLNSIAGFGDNHTMKVRGQIGEEEIVILIDSGATHNFISEKLHSKKDLPMDEIPEYTITVGYGYTLKWKQRCKDLYLKLDRGDLQLIVKNKKNCL
ncbi:uncharacterized protein LOC129311735 isoform X1 [Prosopis cineraria]|uniref:uncharacterized protein LOC129311735 isoform X1 n=1 Tax=Prosopis cineraria TaxID=364024 RepID=UPI00241067C7|nr:uncharacterized protein LOC129311735 isoform X1 [Prosopis cineraria]